MTDSNERLREARLARGFSNPTDAARAFGWNVNTYRSHENGNREISKSAAIRYSKAFGVSMDWLLTGNNKSGTNGEHNNKKQIKNQVPLRYVPLIEINEALMSIAAIKDKKDIDSEEIAIVSLPGMGRNLLAIQANDDSMQEIPPVSGVSFNEGDYVVFDLDADHRPGDTVLVIDPAQEAAFFRKYRIIKASNDNNTVFEFLPLNQNYPPIQIKGKPEDIIVGRLVQRISSFI